MKYLIVGLGNIGAEYAHTRHNIGFDVLDAWAQQSETEFETDRYAFKAEIKFRGKKIVLIKPTTYMNLSGKAVSHWLKTEGIPVERMLVITDDLALPVAKLRMRAKGSAGGHNGLKDIIARLGTDQFSRIKFGVGDNFSRGRQVEYVLGRWSDDEQLEVNQGIERAIKMSESFVVQGVERTMNEWN